MAKNATALTTLFVKRFLLFIVPSVVDHVVVPSLGSVGVLEECDLCGETAGEGAKVRSIVS